MGVPGLNKWISFMFKRYVRRFQKGEFFTDVDNMYIDANGPLHEAAQKNYHYGAFSELAYLNESLSYQQCLQNAFDDFFEELKTNIKIVNPKKSLYIFLDGPAPRAKQLQQRQRRFLAAASRTEKPFFDSNLITPGTDFMADLTLYSKYAIRKMLNSMPEYRNLEIIFSPPSVPGEGEHKIMDYIRKFKLSTFKQTHCIYGPDADLIMLCFATHLPYISLLKKDPNDPGYYYYMDMGRIKRDLPRVLNIKKDGDYHGAQYSSRRKYDEISDDFILQGFFVGNDFLPKIQMFHHIHDGMKFMIEAYTETSEFGTKNFLTTRSKINLHGLRVFVKFFAAREEELLVEQITTTEERKQPPSEEYVNKTLAATIYKRQNGSYGMHYDQYSKNYYKKIGITTKDDLQLMCKSYLKTLIWIFIYYVHGIPSWNWSYEYYYAPLMRDFSYYIAKLTDKEFEEIYNFHLGKPSKPFEQLLAVLPPQSSDILPEEYRSVFTELNNYYPTSFKRDFEGKLKEHEAPVLLPFIDYKVLDDAYVKVIPKRTYIRNEFGQNESFRYDSSYTASFTSSMGNIPLMHVKKSIL